MGETTTMLRKHTEAVMRTVVDLLAALRGRQCVSSKSRTMSAKIF